MLNVNSHEKQPDLVPEKFIIIYDKFTKTHAVSLRNSIKNYTCTIWNDKTYKDNEYRLTNRNYLIVLNENIVKENLANPAIKPFNYLDGIDIRIEGNTLGFEFNSKTCPSQFDNLKKNWKKYLLSTLGPILVAGGIPGAIILSYYLFCSDKNKIKYKLFFDAINKFKDGDIENFLNGKLG